MWFVSAVLIWAMTLFLRVLALQVNGASAAEAALRTPPTEA